MTDKPAPGGPGGSASIGTNTVARVGYGAMQLFETSADDAAAVLRRAVELGVNHIDTASFYGPGEVNRRIRAALSPYPDDLVIVSKAGARYTGEEPVPLAAAQRPAELRAAVEDDLRQLGIERVPVVNLRRLDLGPGLAAEGDQIVDVDDQLAEMIALRDEGKIGAIGVSSVPLDVLRRALPAGIVCVQNAYSLLDRSQEEMLEVCKAQGGEESPGCRTSRSGRRSRVSPRSPTTPWWSTSPANSASCRLRSGWRGCWLTHRIRC